MVQKLSREDEERILAESRKQILEMFGLADDMEGHEKLRNVGDFAGTIGDFVKELKSQMIKGTVRLLLFLLVCGTAGLIFILYQKAAGIIAPVKP